jgi:hypothetical protein
MALPGPTAAADRATVRGPHGVSEMPQPPVNPQAREAGCPAVELSRQMLLTRGLGAAYLGTGAALTWDWSAAHPGSARRVPGSGAPGATPVAPARRCTDLTAR